MTEKTARAEFNYWMTALSSLAGAMSVINLIVKTWRIGLKPIFRAMLEFYRDLFHPIVDGIVWFVMLPLRLVPDAWVSLVIEWITWAWNSAWWVFVGWWIGWILPRSWIDMAIALYSSVLNMSFETYKDLFVICFALVLPYNRIMFWTEAPDSGSFTVTERGITTAMVTVMALIASAFMSLILVFGPVVLLGALFAAFEDLGDDSRGARQYFMVLAVMTAAVVAFFALNAQS